MSTPTDPHPTDPRPTGGCLCGRVRYRLARVPTDVGPCHCRICQRASGAAFLTWATVPRAELEVTGEPAWFRSSPAARRGFCPTCGTRRWHRSSEDSDWLTLKVGTLDDSADVEPRGHLWVSKKQPWIPLDPSIPAFDTQPDDVQAWRTSLR